MQVILSKENNYQELKDYIVYKYNGGSYTKEIRSESFYFKGIKLCGKVERVNSFADIKVQVVDCFPDLKILNARY